MARKRCNPKQTREEYIAMVEAWPRAEILKLFRAARITAHKIDTNRALAERLWERIGKFAKNPRRSTVGRTARVSLGRYAAACQQKKEAARLRALIAQACRSNPKPIRKVSYFHGIGYNGANVTHGGRRYVYVTSVLGKRDLARSIGTPLTRLGKVGETKHGDPVWSYAGRLSTMRRNPKRRRNCGK